MNAQQNPIPLSGETRDSALSALVDGELPSGELDALLLSVEDAGEVHQAWSTYHVIGDVLRGSVPAKAQQSPQIFLAGIHARLNASAPASGANSLQVSKGLAETRRGTAANDTVFRWKMVAGFASLAAVVAVSVTLISSGRSGAGADLAQANSPAGAAVLTSDPRLSPAQQVLVDTPQGPVLRDPQLEALLAQHRQYGDMSALQMPSGFLRNATYDAPAR